MAAVAALTAAASPVVTDVTLSRAAKRQLRVDYTVSEPAVITIDAMTNGVSIGSELVNTFTGDCRKVVSAGTHVIMWDGSNYWPDTVTGNDAMTVAVKAWATNSPPDYMVVDLTGTNSEHVAWFETEADLPGGSVLQDVYKTDKLVMRRIHAAGVRWRMGKMGWEDADGYGIYEAPHDVVLSNDYYMGVFELTQRQFLYLKNTDSWNFAYPGLDKHPAERFTYSGIRGSGTTYNFASRDHAVPNGFFTRMRSLANGICFDLPSSAQWEFACRAGLRSRYPNGDNFDPSDCAWTSANWSADTSITSNMTHEVGLLKPNAWGLYDTVGNVWELCGDRAISSTGDYSEYYYMEEDPVGPLATEASNFLRCGGSWKHNIKLGHCGARIPTAEGFQDGTSGVRLWCACEAK